LDQSCFHLRQDGFLRNYVTKRLFHKTGVKGWSRIGGFLLSFMSSFTLVLILVLLRTVLGSATLLVITVKYYWGERGAPPHTGDIRRRQKEAELRMRAKQIEYSETHRREPRRSDFFDNRKRSKA
jgi:hypothetical protein